MEKEIWVGLYVLLGLYVLYRLFFKKSDADREYEQIYNEVISSDKYKVKGQYGK